MLYFYVVTFVFLIFTLKNVQKIQRNILDIVYLREIVFHKILFLIVFSITFISTINNNMVYTMEHEQYNNAFILHV